MFAAGFEPTISADERPLTYALDRVATGISKSFFGFRESSNSLKKHAFEQLSFTERLTIAIRGPPV